MQFKIYRGRQKCFDTFVWFQTHWAVTLIVNGNIYYVYKLLIFAFPCAPALIAISDFLSDMAG